jgi:hypothetical protein
MSGQGEPALVSYLIGVSHRKKYTIARAQALRVLYSDSISEETEDEYLAHFREYDVCSLPSSCVCCC